MTATGGDHWGIGEFDYNRMARGMNGRETWAMNQPPAYVYHITRNCYCPGPAEAEVYVVNDQVVRVKSLPDGQVFTDAATLGRFRTIPQLFQQIDRILDARPDRVSLELDRYLGYPARFSADPSYRMADEGIDYRIDWLKPLKPAGD